MTSSLVSCIVFAFLSAVVAAAATLLGGWGWVAALAMYSLAGSTSLVTAAYATCAAGPEQRPAPVIARRGKDGRAFA